MKIESIVFNCPIIKRGHANFSYVFKAVAPSISCYFNNTDVFKSANSDNKYSKIYLIAVRYGDDLFVLQKSRKLVKLTKIANSLSTNLDTTLVIIKALRNDEDEVELEVVYTTDNKKEISDDSDNDEDLSGNDSEE